MGGSNVRCRNGHSLASDQLEKAVSSGIQRYAAMADGDCGMYCDCCHLSVRHGGHATVYIFPVLI